MPTLYRLKLSLLEPHRLITELHRIIEVQGDVRFDELKSAIVQSFDHPSDGQWQFIIARQKMDNAKKLTTHKEIVPSPNFPNNLTDYQSHAPTQSFDDLGLETKDYLYLWLPPNTDNSAQDLVFRIRIEKISQDSSDTPIRLIKSVGQFTTVPPATESIATSSEEELDFEVGLVSALMLIASGGDGEPVRWQELVDNGVADELVKRNLIKPCVSPTHIVRMTAYGESELLRFLTTINAPLS